jgi:hypothetical protein
VLFYLVLNADRATVDTCAQQFKASLAGPDFAETAQSPALLQGMALRVPSRAALRAQDETHGVEITIESAASRVRPRGIVLNATERSSAEPVVGAVGGVTKVNYHPPVLTLWRQLTSTKS